MIEAYISGQAARVAFVQGSEITFIDADDPTKEMAISEYQLATIFSDATDVERLVVKQKEDSYAPLLEKYSVHRALHMADVALDTELSEELRVAAAEVFVELTENDNLLGAVKSILYARPLSTDGLEAAATSLFYQVPRFELLLQDLAKSRVLAQKVTAAFERAGKSRSDDDVVASMWSTSVEKGLFRDLIEAGTDPVRINSAAFRCYTVLALFPRSRAFVQDWTRDLTVAIDRRNLIQTPEPEESGYNEHSWTPRVASPHAMYSAVRDRQDVILAQLRSGNVRDARQYADNLVQWQLQNSDSAFASKSMSKLAFEARLLKHRSVELEWAKAATELNPVDAKAVSLLADTYLDLFRLREAEDAFRSAIELGQREFGLVGVARTWRAAGKLAEASSALQDVINEFQGSRTIFYGWAIAAEICRELGQPEQALNLYEDALREFPEELHLWIGKGSTLRDMHDTEAAEQWLTKTVRTYPRDSAPLCILAEVYRDTGRLTSSLETYARARELFPRSHVVRSGMAEVLFEIGRTEEAVQLYSDARTEFPNESVVFCGFAECLRNSGKLEESLLAYDDAIRRFPLDLPARGGRANLLKVMGRHQDALNAYDLNIRDFPFDLVSMSNRANLLRLLGRYGDAITAYDLVIERRPDFVRARYAKAAILGGLRNFSAAFDLLPKTRPITDDDWFAYHVRGMLNLRMNSRAEAIHIFAFGKEHAPHSRQQQFERSWAVAKMRDSDFSVAAHHLDQSHGTLEQLFKARCLMELGDSQQAILLLDAANDNNYPSVIAYRNELERRARGGTTTSGHFEDAEAELLLQAA